MRMQHLELGQLGTNCYLVENDHGAFVIDPACDADKILAAAEEMGVRITAVILTHGHYDHIAAADDLGVESIHMHQNEEQLYLNPDYNLSGHFGAAFFGSKQRTLLADGDVFMGFTVIYTPGHTPGGICLYCEEENTLFSGDTLFCAGYGRTDFPGGSMMKLRESLMKLLALPEETKVYPGHGIFTTIAQERRNLGWRP